MPPRTTAQTAATTRAKMFWALIATLAVGQLIAIWMLCSHQVRQAELRSATVQVERVALQDCLRFIPRATPQHCAARLAARHEPDALAKAAENTAHISAASARGVSFQLR
jgi:hypothetical protein